MAAFGLCAGCFLALSLFGNAAAPWVIGVLVCGVTLFSLIRLGAVVTNIRLWLSGMAVQSEPGPGFSALEVAAIQDLLAQAGPEAQALGRHFAGAEVVERYNSGTGNVTTIRSATPHPVLSDAVAGLAWFHVDGVSGIVGARFWVDQKGLVTLLEFFTGGEGTARLDWTRARFEPASGGAPRPTPPSMPPIVSEPRWIRYRPESGPS